MMVSAEAEATPRQSSTTWTRSGLCELRRAGASHRTACQRGTLRGEARLEWPGIAREGMPDVAAVERTAGRALQRVALDLRNRRRDRCRHGLVADLARTDRPWVDDLAGGGGGDGLAVGDD